MFVNAGTLISKRVVGSRWHWHELNFCPKVTGMIGATREYRIFARVLRRILLSAKAKLTEHQNLNCVIAMCGSGYVAIIVIEVTFLDFTSISALMMASPLIYPKANRRFYWRLFLIFNVFRSSNQFF